jgi:glycosyltransferase involved in cell wall biosynthesis
VFGGAAELRNPHPRFAARYYLDGAVRKGVDRAKAAANPLLHYLSLGSGLGIDPHPEFSVAYYRGHNPDVARTGRDPLVHYVLEGEAARRPSVPNRRSLVRRPLGWRHDHKPKLRILHFLHEGSRTGAPYILLRILERFARNPDVENVVFIDRGGPLIPAFREIASTFELDDCRAFGFAELDAIGGFLDGLDDDVPCVALFNSVCNAHFVSPFAQRCIPIVYLVHEFAGAFPSEYFLQAYDGSNWVVYPAQIVRDRNRMVARIPVAHHEKELVIPQGLLHPGIAAGNRAGARAAIRAELDVADDALIVLGCGSLDLRKGIDLFTATAMATTTGWRDPRPLVFIWIGGGRTETHSPYYYVTHDIEVTGRTRQIRFLGERSDTAPYFLGADLFFLSSREDPFPCVVHEAMACGLPVVAFAEAGGAQEALQDGAGVVVPYGDVPASTREITSLLLSPERRDEIARRAAERVDRLYDFDAYCRALVPLLAETTHGRLDPSPLEAIPEARVPIFVASPDGSDPLTETLVRGLIERGLDARIILSSRAPVCRRDWIQPSVPYAFAMDLEKDGGWDEGRAACEEFLVRHRPCVLMPNGDPVLSSLAPRLPSSVGVVLTVSGEAPESLEEIGRFGRYANRVVGASEEVMRALSSFAELSRRLELVPIGVPALPSVDRLPVGERPVRLLHFGSFRGDGARIRHYADLVTSLSQEGLDFVLTLAFRDQEDPQLAVQMAPFVAAGTVRLLRGQEDEELRRELNFADFLISLTDHEGLPFTILRAMAEGCVPLVKTARAEIRRLIDHGKSGWLIGANTDAPDLPALLRQILRQPDRLRAASARARDFVREHHPAERMVDDHYRILVEVMDELKSGSYVRPRLAAVTTTRLT